jgi:transposase
VSQGRAENFNQHVEDPQRNTPFAKVNPKQARRIAEASGRMAKTDRVDAAMLARMGAVPELELDKPNLHQLKELAIAPRALMKDKVAAKTRLQNITQKIAETSNQRSLETDRTKIRQIDTAIADMVAQDQVLSHKRARPQPQ